MKVLQINVRYNYGSTGKITKDIHYGLMERGYESVVLYGRIDKTDDKNVYKVCNDFYSKLNNLWSRFTGVMYGGCYFSTRKIIEKIKEEKPDIVHLQCINGYFVNIYKLLEWLKTNNYKTVLTLHAEFMYTANCGHAEECNQWINGCRKCNHLKKHTKSLFFDRTGYSWKKMHEIYENWDNLTIVACSDWIRKRAIMSKGFRDKYMVKINNGIENDKIFCTRNSAEKVKRNYNIPSNNKIVMYIAPEFSKLKGFDYALKLIEECDSENIQFLLVGDKYETERENITVTGKVKDQNYLAELYSAADVMIMCSRNDNYPTVCLEAISCGTHVVGFDIGGVSETIYTGMGKCVEFGDITAMKEAVISLVTRKPEQSDIIAARNYNSKNRMIEEYIELYNEIVQRGMK